MKRLNRTTRRWIAIGIWAFSILLFLGMGFWNLESSRQDAENRLIGEAGRTAAQISGLLALPGAKLDKNSIQAIVIAAMEDDRIYAIRIQSRSGIKDGRRRDYLWEPVPWDEELAENCIQGMNPIRIGGRIEGKVDVWLSPRLSEEEDSLLAMREKLRFVIASAVATFVLLLLLWHWGDLAHWRNVLLNLDSVDTENAGLCEEKIILGLSKAKKTEIAAACAAAKPTGRQFVDAASGRAFQHNNPDAWLVTAGMFRQTFGRAPGLMSRLFAEGELAALCHLGRMLEQAGPCIGARPLVEAAKAMRAAVNDPERENTASSVEKCVHVLEQTLAALSCSDNSDIDNASGEQDVGHESVPPANNRQEN